MIDLRSDTKTKPSAEMRAAIAAAEVGDEQRREDPTVNRLEQMAAELLGQPEALFVPTATMANEIALRIHGEPGDEVIAEENSHIFIAELGGPAVHAGLMTRPLRCPNGRFTPEQIRETYRRSDGTHVPNFGPNPMGMLIFTADGHYSLQIERAGRPKFAANTRTGGTAGRQLPVPPRRVREVGDAEHRRARARLLPRPPGQPRPELVCLSDERRSGEDAVRAGRCRAGGLSLLPQAVPCTASRSSMSRRSMPARRPSRPILTMARNSRSACTCVHTVRCSGK